MTRKIVPTALVALLLVAGVVPATAAGLTVVYKVTGPKGTPPTSIQHFDRDMVHTYDGRYHTVLKLETGEMIHWDEKKKTSSTTSLEEMRAHFAELEQMLDDNPLMAKMMGGATEVEVQKGSGGQTVAGYECNWYLFTVGKKTRFEICAAPGLEAPVSYYDASKMAYAAMGPMGSRFEKIWEAMKQIDGFPLIIKMFANLMGFKLDNVNEAIEVRKGPVPPEVFEGPPPGYKDKSPYKKK